MGMRAWLAAVCVAATCGRAPAAGPPLLFHVSFDKDVSADTAAGRPQPWRDQDTTIVPGRFGSAVALGQDRPALTYDGPENVLAGRGTIALWCRYPARPGPLDTQRILLVQARERGQWCILGTMEWHMGAFQAMVYDHDFGYGLHDPAGMPALKPGEWHHVALVWDQARGVRFYLDGKPAGSTWGRQAWWDRPTPHAIHLAWPGATYDELRVYSAALSDEQIADLARGNAGGTGILPVDVKAAPGTSASARAALIASLGPGALDDLLTVEMHAGPGRPVALRQACVKSILDDRITGWRIVDGRMNLFWPEWRCPILGDVDFGGTEIKAVFEPGQRFDWMGLRGRVGGLRIQSLLKHRGRMFVSQEPWLVVPRGLRSFWSRTLNGLALDGLRMVRQDKVRLHELHLWSREDVPQAHTTAFETLLTGPVQPEALGELAGEIRMRTLPEERRVFGHVEAQVPRTVTVPALTRYHVVTDPAHADVFLDAVELRLQLVADWPDSVLWIRLVDPVNRMRDMAYIPVRLRNPAPGKQVVLDLVLDTWDIVLDKGRRLWIELMHEQPTRLVLGGTNASAVVLLPGEREKVTAEFLHTQRNLAKSYWWLGSEARGYAGALPEKPRFALLGYITYNRELRDTLMWIMRHAPNDRYATSLWKVIWDRRATREVKPRLAPEGAPEWAVWERDLIERYVQMAHCWADLQGPDGQIGGGWNDDTDFPGVFLCLPLLGDERTTNMFEGIWDGLEETGYLKDGFARTPADVLHSTDFFSFRAHLMMFRYGEPRWLERALTLTRSVLPFTGLDEQGGRRFIANYFGEDGPEGAPNWRVNSGGLISPVHVDAESQTSRCFLRDALFYAWYSRNPTVLKILREFAEGDSARVRNQEERWGSSAYLHYTFFSYYTIFGDSRYIGPPFDKWMAARYSLPIWRRMAEGVFDTKDLDKRILRVANSRKPRASIQLAPAYLVKPDKRYLVRAIRSVVERLAGGWQFRGGEAGGANDHFSIDGQEVLAQMALGIALSWRRPGSIVPQIDVSWEGIGTSVAPLVLEGTTSKVKVAVYNFDEKPRPVVMRVWRLAPGTYRVRVGPDADGDDAMDGQARTSTHTLQRASRIPLALPARRVAIVEVSRVKGRPTGHPMPHPTGPAPDLAVGKGDIYYDLATDRLKVVVHNVGAVAARDIRVAFHGSDGTFLGTATIPRLDAPLDLFPRTATAWVPAPLRHPVEAIIATVDPDNTIPEINEENNRIRWVR